MRILHVTEAFGAGVATAIEQYVRHTSHFQHEVLGRVRERSVGGKAAAMSAPAQLVESRAELVKCWLQLRHQQFDVVHAHSTVAGLITRTIPHIDAPLVYSPHALAIGSNRQRARRLIVNAAEQFLAKQTSVFAAVSKPESEQLAQLGKGAIPVVTIPHAVPLANPRAVHERRREVVAFGRLSYQKAPETVTGLPQELYERLGSAVDCIWIGDGDHHRRQALEEGGWHVTGWLSQEAAHTIVAGARVLVHPARYEGMPLAVLEAMSMGTPVVARAIPGICEIAGVVTYETNHDLLASVAAIFEETMWTSASHAARDGIRTMSSDESQRAALIDAYRIAIDSQGPP